LGPAGNRTKVTEADGTVRDYSYDPLYRLTSERVTINTVLDYEKTFGYDPAGNRLQQVTMGSGAPGTPTAPGTVDSSYDTRDRLLTETGLAGGYTYDDNGNLVTRAGQTSYTWDLENRLTRVSKADGTLVDHVYDVDGNRVQTKVTPASGPAATTNFLVDTSGALSQVIAESDATGTLTAYYQRADDDLIAILRPSGPSTYAIKYVLGDHLGSIRRLTDASANVTDQYSTDAFGELIAHTGTDPQPYAFAGEPYDPTSGFQYHRARWMDPRTGRSVGMDPFGGNEFDPPSLHRYLYAHGNPVSSTDPTGRFTLPSLGAISMALNTINSISLLSTAAIFGYRAGTIANDLLIEEKIELEDALEEAADLGGDIALSIAGYRLLNFEGLKFAGSLMRKLPSMVGRIKLWNVARVNGRLAEHYIGNAYGLFRNAVRVGGRTPDFLTGKVLREIKNVIELRWSGRVAAQLRDYADFCQQTGRQFNIHVRPGTMVDPRVEAELLQRFGPGSRGVLWDIIADIPESLRVIP